MENAGLTEKDVNLLDMQPSEIYAAWQNGQIDAAYIWEPTLSQMEDAVTVCTSSDMADAGYMTTNLEMVRTEFADANPDIVVAYIKAVNKEYITTYNTGAKQQSCTRVIKMRLFQL